MRSRHIFLPAVLLFACLAGCGSDEPLRITSMQLGRAINTDKTIAGHTTRFAPDDRVYVSVLTAGAGAGEISVRWLYAGRVVVGEPKKQVSYMDIAATEFQLQSADGFLPGDYSVEAFLDGQSAGTRTFRVEKPQ